jgi:hypothetical protein
MSSTFVITDENNESYVGYEDLISYLRGRKNKSYRGFLHRNREIIVESSFFIEVTSWQDYDNAWAVRFLKKAEEFDQINFNTLKEKVRIFILQRKVTPS